MIEIRINNRVIGCKKPPYIVAEAGINHNGELNNAIKMVEVASRAGANAIKFQTFKAEEFVGDPKQEFTYTSQGKEVTETMLEMFKRCELSRDDWFKIKKKCDDEKIQFLSTPQNYSDLELLLELNIPLIKVGSDDFTNIPLIKKYSTTKLPIILSSGMASFSEIFDSLEAVGAFENYPTILLSTTSQYPTPPEDVNLLKLDSLRNAFPDLPIGFSDHTKGPLASSLAVAFGACLLEKHFTLDHQFPGPDHWFSEDPEGLQTWIQSIKKSYTMMGSSIIRPTEAEKEMKILARRSVIAIHDIKEGDKLDHNNIGLKRPGRGLSPVFFNKIIGKSATKKILKGTLLKFGDFK